VKEARGNRKEAIGNRKGTKQGNRQESIVKKRPAFSIKRFREEAIGNSETASSAKRSAPSVQR